MAIELLPLYLKANVNNVKPSLFGYRYDIVFPRGEDVQRKYEPQQSRKIFPPPVNTVQDGEEDKYNPKSSNRLESFHYNSLSTSDSDGNGGHSAVETTTNSDAVDTTDATSGVGYSYDRPTGDNQFLFSQRETPEQNGEHSPSASSLNENIELLGRVPGDADTLPRVTVRFQSSSFAEDGIPIAYDNEANETVRIANLHRIM